MSKKKLDLLLINPGDRVEIYQTLGSSGISAVEPPIWAGLIASYMLTKGYSVEIIDANAEQLTSGQVVQRVQDANPTLTAVVAYGHNPSASTQVMPSAGRICTAIKALIPRQPLLLVGGHVASLPERTLYEEAADFVCTGEGPVTIWDLVECLKVSNDYQKVRGLMYQEDGKRIKNSPAPNVINLDEEMPGMPWHLLPMSLYKAHGWHCLGYPTRKPYASVYTTLGCPYQCEFCCIQEPFKEGERFQRTGKLLLAPPTTNSYRLWSPELVVKEIKYLVEEYGIRHLKIADEMWDLNLKHCRSIYEGLIQEGIGDHINIWGYSRVDTVKDDATVELSLKAGLRWYCLGIESASERVRNDMRKGEYDLDDIIKVVERIRKIGISIQANYIVGLPEDDLETMQQTLDLAIQLNTEWMNVYSAMAYPGSKLYTRAVNEGWPLPESWIGFSQHAEGTYPLPTKYLTGKQVLTFRDYFHKKYFSNPAHGPMLEQKFGPLALKHVEDMMSQKLVRKYAEPISELGETQ